MDVPNHIRTFITLLTAALPLLVLPCSSRANSSATVVVHDSLCLPGEEIYIEATLYGAGLLGFLQRGIQGELLRFFDPKGNCLRSLLTDTSGLARVRYEAGPPGHYPITVRLVKNPRYSAEPATGNLFVQQKGLPLFFVTVDAGLMPPNSTPFLPRNPQKVAPEPGSAKALAEIASCHMVVYLTQWPKPLSHQIRSWLENKGYPLGPIYFLVRPPVAGMMSDAPVPDTDLLESLWKERSVPAHLATGDRSLAEAARDKGVRVLLLTPESSTDSTPVEEEEGEDKQGEKGQEESIQSCPEWSAIPAICPCKNEET
jgi:hypothetical protein